MPAFSKNSLNKLRTCDINLQVLFNEVVKDYDCTIVFGYRNEIEQNEAFNKGNSKVQYPMSKHNTVPSLAVDAAPYVNGGVSWNLNQCYHFSGYVLGIWNTLKREGKVYGTLRCGADWSRDYSVTDETFIDCAHFELIH